MFCPMSQTTKICKIIEWFFLGYLLTREIKKSKGPRLLLEIILSILASRLWRTINYTRSLVIFPLWKATKVSPLYNSYFPLGKTLDTSYLLQYPLPIGQGPMRIFSSPTLTDPNNTKNTSPCLLACLFLYRRLVGFSLKDQCNISFPDKLLLYCQQKGGEIMKNLHGYGYLLYGLLLLHCGPVY